MPTGNFLGICFVSSWEIIAVPSNIVSYVGNNSSTVSALIWIGGIACYVEILWVMQRFLK